MIEYEKVMPAPEIMAPVGSFEALTAAINAGCDSVYFGVTQLNMRARSAHNFEIDEIADIVSKCKKAGVKSYVTLNTLLYEHDLPLMKKILDTAKSVGADAVIAQDIGAISYASLIALPVHASTQLSISNFESVKFFAKFCDTIVLARELDISMIKSIIEKIKENDLRGPFGEIVRIECFVHGALCIAQSGRCQMSLLKNNTSAQRGACLQECRKKYKIIDEENGEEMNIRGGYVLSPKDLCSLPFLDKLISIGINVFKIEGRARSPEYVKTVVKAYKEAVASVLNGNFSSEKASLLMNEVNKVYNRGFSSGYYLGENLPDWSCNGGSVATEEKVFVGTVCRYYPKIRVAEIFVNAYELKINDSIYIQGQSTGIVRGKVKKILIDNSSVSFAPKKSTITIPFQKKVRTGDKVFIIKQRNNANARH